MTDFVPGQRWVVDSQPELGLGVVVSVELRTVQLVFPAGDCERTYAREKAPLTRIKFEANDQIHLADGGVETIAAVEDVDGLLVYYADSGSTIPETALSGEIKMHQPFLRLLTGQLEGTRWFSFRRAFDSAMAKAWHSQLVGLLGIRANLIPHQLYVAHTACNRERVRVLLSDEVGLGKTIEAGMILSRLTRYDRVQKCLIIVPDALQVQWLVELIRRFNIKPEFFAESDHDFNYGQTHLLPHSTLKNPALFADIAQDFDLVIVDEAHNVQIGSGPFQVLEDLAKNIPHLILLSATPEQLGFESHFARLNLLDPDKFADPEAFKQQEESYAQLNQKIRGLPDTREQLISEFKLDDLKSDQELIDELLDCHGIGRVMYRNTRSAIQGFPERNVQLHELESDDWDSRYQWLSGLAKDYPNEKILVICHDVQRVYECENYMWDNEGADVALFHEEMDLIERDRSAAYFADFDKGSQLLLCSEIGSEGRNFQFCGHLVCLDLPDHPDLLEQRIGRLDRIGQTRDINIHLLFAPGSEEAFRLDWYHNVLGCIEKQSPAAGAVHDQYWALLEHRPEDQSIRDEAKATHDNLERQIQEGRDALLELNSCRQPQANELVNRISEFDLVTPFKLVESASNLFNFHFEESHHGVWSIVPSDKMLVPALPGIPPEGCEVTFERDIANAREDSYLLSWDSPFVVGLWDLLRETDLGSASVALLPSEQLPAGRCLLESCFDVVIQSPWSKECLQFLSELSVRTVFLDVGDKDLSAVLAEKSLESSLEKVEKSIARKIILSRKDELPEWYQKSEAYAEVKQQDLVRATVEKMNKYFGLEKERLQKLARVNPSVSLDDVKALDEKHLNMVNALQEKMILQLSCIRLIVTT